MCDVCFYKKVEASLLGRNGYASTTLDEWNIVEWYRYKDDILFISDGDIDAEMFLSKLNENGIWKLEAKADDINAVGITYLDLNVANGGDRVLVYPAYRPSALGRRLSKESAHFKKVHTSWVRMMFQRVESKCLNVSVDLQRDNLSLLLVQQGACPHIIEFVRNFVGSRHASATGSGILNRRADVFWMTLPFNPIWSTAISRKVIALNHDDDYKALICCSNRFWK
jgi:hypothetical protein